ncbi:3290_t:CDS:2, partial [Dentiscutata heterogama]
PQIQQYLASESFIDQFEICRIYTSESRVVLNGKEKNYPLTINFNNLPKRIEKLFSELLKIVTKQTQSLYRDQVINVFKNYENNPRKPSVLIGRFNNFIPGYYGAKGLYIIKSTLYNLITSKEITYSMTKPLKPDEYLDEVLVPETAVRLIAQNRRVELDQANEIMKDSAEFGMYIHDIEIEM